MLFRSKSVITIIGLGIISLVCLTVGTLLLRNPEITEFSEDGYILTASAEEGAENVMVSGQIWFGQGASWKAGREEIRFTDAQGNDIQAPEDSFVHYSDNSITCVKNISVMDLDEFSNGMIRYYTLDQGVPLNWNGSSYFLGEGDETVLFRNFIMKSSSSRYMLGSQSIYLIQAEGRGGANIEGGFVELEYLSEDKSVALLNDGVSAWQFLTEDAYLELDNGVRLNLSTGELELPEGSPVGGSQSKVYVDDIEVTVSQEKIWQNWNGYPVYRFTVINGEDGKAGEEGASGESGETGEDGDEGEQGTEGTSQTGGNTGDTGNTGNSGIAGEAGSSGGQMSGVTVSTSVPVVTLKNWTVNGKTLKFTVYADEVSCNSVVEETTRISLVDIGTGQEVYYWDWEGDLAQTGQQIDLSEDSAEGFELYCSALEPGHQYRFTIHADYIVNDMTGSQALLTRNFAADDYGVAFELTDRTSNSFTFALRATNRLVDVESVDVLVDGVHYGYMQRSDFDSYDIDLGIESKHANQTCNISFRPVFNVSSFDSNGDMVTVQMGTDGSISYDYTVTTLKLAPTVGGVRLTAYDSGYLMAELLGQYDGNRYQVVQDEDDTIQNIRFELYDSLHALNAGTSPVAVENVKSGYLAYFQVSDQVSDPVHLNQNYYLRAYYTWNDGQKELELPVLETYRRDGENESHQINSFSWDLAKLTSLIRTTLSFYGDGETWNTSEEAMEGRNSGVTFNAIAGSIKASLSTNNRYVISGDHPMELQISGTPDYYRSLRFGGCDTNPGEHILYALDPSAAQTEVSMSTMPVITIPVDLTGLKADTPYMFTLYGYEKTGTDSYNRVTMGSVAVTTRSERTISLKMARDYADTGVGVALCLGQDTSHNYYNKSTMTYETGYKAGTKAAYRGLNSITFELYREGSHQPLGTCRITNIHTGGADVDKNSIYEDYYGDNAAETLAAYKAQGYKGIVGVGRNNYPYFFVDSEGLEIQPGTLTTGEYYIKASACYDYTEARYDYMDLYPESGLYDYYTYKSSREAYLNQLPIANIRDEHGNLVSGDTSAKMETETLPYIEPGPDLKTDTGDYIKVETLKNSELGAYNGDDSQNELYSPNWDADTVAGLKLTCKYKNDAEYKTESLYYYGFAWNDWKNMNSATDQPTSMPGTNGEGLYQVKCKVDMAANEYINVPEVWLLFYNTRDLQKVDTASTEQGSGISAVGSLSDEKGYLYRQTTQVNGKTVEIYYMDERYFSRGQSYVFAYETELPGYTYTDRNGNTITGGFHYPQSYYEDIQGENYVKNNTLSSSAVSVKRQVPEVHSRLLKTTTVSGYGNAQWKVYVDDPDGAIQWNSILRSAPDNHVPGGSTATDKGGIYTLFGTAMPTMYENPVNATENRYLQFSFQPLSDNSRQILLDTRTVFDPEDPMNPLDPSIANRLTEEDLQEIASWLKNQVEDQDQGSVTDRGGLVTVSNLRAEGVSYKLTADYLLLDDVGYNAATSYTNLPIVQQNYIGNNNYRDDRDKLTLTDPQAAEDHNTMYIYLNPSSNDLAEDVNLANATSAGNYIYPYYLTKDYLNKARTIAGVSLQVYNQSTGQYVYERDSLTGQLDTAKNKTLWLYPSAPARTGAADYRYYMKFKLSDLDEDGGANIQYHPGDELTFHMKVYYLTGQSGGLDSSEYYSEKTYALKFINYIQNSDLYGSGIQMDQARYRFTSNASVIDSNDGAGRSMYRVKPSYESEGTLPWSEQIGIRSETFDLRCEDKNLERIQLSSSGGYSGRSVLELMEIDSYDVGAGTTVTVQSAAPAFERLTATGGIVQVNLEGVVDNWNLVEYPEDEKLHLYYLIYEYTVAQTGAVTKGNLKGAMVGEPSSLIDSEGRLNLNLPFTAQEQKYWIEVYYKDKTAAEAAHVTDWTDAALLGQNVVRGKLYTAAGVTQDITLTGLGNAITADNSIFRIVSGVPSNRVLVSTSSGLEMESLTLDLGETASYKEKKLTIETRISSNILEAEQDSLEIFYRLERCPENESQSVESNWKTVIGDFREKTTITNWAGSTPASENDPQCWQYYDSGTNGQDITRNPVNPTRGRNQMTLPYYAGGQILPGYVYRVKASIYQEVSGNYVLVSKDIQDRQPGGIATSEVVGWSSLSLAGNEQALIQTANVIRSSTSIKLSYRVSDLNYTSLDGRYFVRLAEKQEDGTYKVLEGSGNDGYYLRDATGSWMNRAHTMGDTCRMSYGLNSGHPLSPDTTYRLQFYALMDPEYNNQVNVSDGSGLLNRNLDTTPSTGLFNIMNLTGYYPKQNGTRIGDNYSLLYEKLYNNMVTYERVPDGLTLKQISPSGSESLMIGYSDDITTMSAEMTASPGTYQQTVIGGANLITLKFTGAYNAGSISRITYTLEREGGTSWDAVTVDKASGSISLFDATGSGSVGNGVEGNISLRLELGTAEDSDSMNVRAQGKYYLAIRFETYDENTGRYNSVGSYSIKFYNTTDL